MILFFNFKNVSVTRFEYRLESVFLNRFFFSLVNKYSKLNNMTDVVEETPVIPFSFDKYYYELLNIVRITQNLKL